MVLDAGKYDRSFTWQKYVPANDTTYGQQKPAYVAQSTILWGSIETSGGSKDTYFQSQQETVQAVIRLRQWPTVSALDRLTDRRFNEVWVIDGVRRSNLQDNETIISAHRWEQQAGT